MSKQNETTTEFANLLAEAGLTVAQFCRESKTPRNTADQWYHGTRRTPPVAIWALEMFINNNKSH